MNDKEELKTLNDIDFSKFIEYEVDGCGYADNYLIKKELKQEAIKIIKKCEMFGGHVVFMTNENKLICDIDEFIKWFFDIRDEDLSGERTL